MQLGMLARIVGLIFVVVGGLGFVPQLNQTIPDQSAHLVVGVTTFLFGYFAVNIVHNIVHIFIGLLGLLRGGSEGSARGYFRFLAFVYLLLALLGAIPLTNTLFASAPIFGDDIWLHLGTGIVAGYLGWGFPVTQQLEVKPPAARSQAG